MAASTSRTLLLAVLVSYAGIVLSSPLTDDNVDANAIQPRAIGDISPEGKSCADCRQDSSSVHHPTYPSPDYDLGHLSELGLLGSGVGLLGDTKLMALIVPVIVLQILTLIALAYLLKESKSYGGDDYNDSYYVTQDAGGYGGHSVGYGGHDDGGYKRNGRSLIPDGNTMTWILDGIAGASDMYHQFQDKKSSDSTTTE